MALRNDPSIPPATRANVRAIAQELGYRADPRISELMALLKKGRVPQQEEAIAFVLPHAATGHPLAPYIATCIEEGSRQAHKRGYRFDVFALDDLGIPPARLQTILRARGIRGVIFGPHRAITGAVELDCARLATVTVGYSVVAPSTHRIVIDHYRNLHLAMAELVARGYERIGLLITPETDLRSRELVSAGFYSFARLRPKADRVEAYVGPREAAAVQAWRRRERPDAVVGFGADWLDLLLGGRPQDPETLGYAAVDWSPPDRRLAGVPYRNDEVAREAVDYLIASLQTNEFGLPALPRTICIPCSWQEGPTVRARRRPIENPHFFPPVAAGGGSGGA